MRGLCLISCVRNEADIIESFVRHNLAFAERLWILDHHSSDATPEILKQLQLEGLPIEVVRESRAGNFQAEWMTRLLRGAAEAAGTKWICPLDADELLRPVSGEWEKSLPESGCVSLPMQTFVARKEDDPGQQMPIRRIRHRVRDEDGGFCKVVVSAELARRRDGFLQQGNHAFCVGGENVPAPEWKGMVLAHFPIRSPQQYAVKVVTSYLQSRRYNTPLGEPFTYSADMFGRLKQQFSAAIERFDRAVPAYLEREASALVEDPVPYAGQKELQYAKPFAPQDWMMQAILSVADELAGPETISQVAEPTRPTQFACLRFSMANGIGHVSSPLAVDHSEVRRHFIRSTDLGTPAGETDLRLQIHSTAGALQVVAARFFTLEGAPPVVVSGRALGRLISGVESALSFSFMGSVYLLKSRYVAGFTLRRPEAAPSWSAIELEMRFVDPERLGEMVTTLPVVSELAAGQTQTELNTAQEQIAQLTEQLQAARRTCEQQEASIAYLRQKAEETAGVLRFLKNVMPLNRLFLELRRVRHRNGERLRS